jgi:hypothetical protein
MSYTIKFTEERGYFFIGESQGIGGRIIVRRIFKK